MTAAAARVVCAPNAFKGTISAIDAAHAMAYGVRDAGAEAREIPVADGGDGTLDVLLAAHPGSRTTRHRVADPLGSAVSARIGWLGDGIACVELAEASGLRLLADRAPDPLRATSRGIGELILAALEGSAEELIVGVGGSASTDGGAGLLQALGARLLDRSGREIGPGGGALHELDSMDLRGLDPRLERVGLMVASDVGNPLLGPDGAAAVFAPQKGAAPEEVATLDAGLAHLAAVAARDAGAAAELALAPGSGAAGGAGFGLLLAGADLVPGASLVCDLVGFDDALADADLVLTGEGRLDAQTAMGKAPSEVARRAAAARIPCIAIAGSVVDPLRALFAAAIELHHSPAGGGMQPDTATLVRRAAADAVTQYGVGSPPGDANS